MKEKFKVFNNPEFGSLDVLVEDEKVYFPATECAKILGYSEPQNAIRRHTKGCVKRTGVSKTTNQHGMTTEQLVEKNFIPEGDLYRLIVRSKLPSAEKFEHWVFDEVLPTIRKYGLYASDNVLEQILTNPEIAIDILKTIKVDRKRLMSLEKENQHHIALLTLLDFKLTYYDQILKNQLSIPISMIAKDYGMAAITFNKLLHEYKIQFRCNNTWILYEKYQNMGFTHSYTHIISPKKAVVHTNWTQKGKLFLYEFLKKRGISPKIEGSN